MRTIIVNGQYVTFNDRAVLGTEILASLGVFGKRPEFEGYFTTEELLFMHGYKKEADNAARY
jgi:hypothetical protein